MAEISAERAREVIGGGVDAIECERRVVVEGAEHGRKLADNGVDAAIDSKTQNVSVVDDEAWNPGINAMAVCATPIVENSSLQTQVIEEKSPVTVNEEGMYPKVVDSGSSTLEGVVSISGREQSLMVEATFEETKKVVANTNSLDEENKVAATGEVAGMDKGDTLCSKVEGMETDAVDENPTCSMEEHWEKVEKVAESSKNHGDVSSDLVFSCLPNQAIVGGNNTEMDDKDPLNTESDQHSKLEECLDKSMAHDPSQMEVDKQVIDAEPVCLHGGLEKVEEQSVKVETVCVSTATYSHVCGDSTSNQVGIVGEAAAGHDKVLSDSNVEVPETIDKDGISSCFGNDENLNVETTCGSTQRDAQVTDGRQTAVMDRESVIGSGSEVLESVEKDILLDSEECLEKGLAGDLSQIDSNIGQETEVKKLVTKAECSDAKSLGQPSLVVLETEVAAEDGNVLNPNFETDTQVTDRGEIAPMDNGAVMNSNFEVSGSVESEECLEKSMAGDLVQIDSKIGSGQDMEVEYGELGPFAMAPENNFQGHKFSAVRDTRQKVDGLKVSGTGKDMESAENVPGQRDQESLKPKPKCNIRKSLAWDSAFFTSPGMIVLLKKKLEVLDPEELFQTLNLRDVGNSLVPSESLKVERKSGMGKSDPRQSLAWDSAFFTSAGVLEPEELSMINKGFKKFESLTLPGVEELWRYKSIANRSTLSDISTSSSNLQGGRRMKNARSSQKVDASSQVRMKPMPTSGGKSTTCRNGLEGVTSEASVPPQAQHGAGAGEFNPKHAARSGELHLPSSLKPPKISKQASRIPTAPTKSASLGTNHVKLETQNLEATSGNFWSGSKKPCMGVSSSGIRSSIPSPQSTNESTISSSSYSRFCGSAANTSGKSPFSSSRATGTRHANLVATGSTFRTPPKYTTKKHELGDSSHPTLLSVSKSSSCTPPASSIDGRTFEALSTSVNQESNNTKTSFYTTMETHQQDEPCFECKSQETSSPIQYVNNFLAESSPVPSDVSRTIKPSSLRRPSPKIGFFDTENPTMPMINRGPQFHSGVRSTLSKSGTGIGAVNRKEYGKLQPPRTLKRPKNMKIDFLTTKRVDDERDYAAKLGLRSTSKAEGKGNMSKMGRECGDQGCLKAKRHSSRKHENASIKSPEMNLHILHEDDKENLYCVEKQVESLSRNIGALDLSSDVMTELREKRGCLLATEHH
ncbi:hypothetical protein FH972_001593 [Carpinus fangiana]|uniref:Uncharacterized protein n=1 Tax=Carpinus fangiana TaxID=176857 RepID=A0A5N6QCK2_9ROSI|nr:hypothetical protein FH972_001593 [Carpinus fangiana]